MSSFVNKFDKPHLPVLLYDLGRKTDMFNAVLSLDTHEILQCNLMYKIPFTITDDNKNSLIHILINNPSKSSELAKLSVIKFLINNGVDPDKPNKYNQTVLHLACNQQLGKIVEYLLENHADPNYKDNSGFTPFHYLLSGSINPVPPTEIIDFIPPTKNVNFAKVQLIKTIKNNINQLLEKFKDLPIFETIQETIIAFIKDDTEIKKTIQEFKDAQLVDLKIADSIYSAGDILQSEKIFQNKITQRINNIFSVKHLDSLMIHIKTATSWVYPENTPEYALIKEGDINKSIRTTIKEQYNALVKLVDTFTPYTINFKSNYMNIYTTIYYKWYIHFLENNKIMYYPDASGNLNIKYSRYQDSTTDDTKENTYNKSSIEKLFMKQDDQLRYKTALDNASSIINFKTLKYTGGPRDISLGNIKKYTNTYEIFDESNNILNELINKSEDVLINSMLDIDSTELLMNYDDSTEKLTEQHTNIIYENIVDYKLLSFNAIKNQQTQETDISTPFGKKWLALWNDGKEFDLGAWIFNMWADCSCRASRSNLIGCVSFKLLILINNLTDTTNIKANIVNSLKPHLISYMTKDINIPLTNDNMGEYSIRLINIIIILLFNSDEFDILLKIVTNPTILQNEYLEKMPNIYYMYYLIKEYFIDNITTRENNIKTFIEKTETNENIKNYYNNYKYDTFIDILCNMILDEYKNMSNKPLKQTMLDFLYLLNKYNTDTNLDVFKSISIIPSLDYTGSIINQVVNDTNNLILMPSYYGYINVINSLQSDPVILDPLNIKYDIILKQHFIIAHILGLYYEGTLNIINTDVFINTLVKIPFNKSHSLFIPGGTAGMLPLWRHIIHPTTNQFKKHQVPLILQFTYIDTATFNSDIQKEYQQFKKDIIMSETIIKPIFKIKYFRDLLTQYNDLAFNIHVNEFIDISNNIDIVNQEWQNLQNRIIDLLKLPLNNTIFKQMDIDQINKYVTSIDTINNLISAMKPQYIGLTDDTTINDNRFLIINLITRIVQFIDDITNLYTILKSNTYDYDQYANFYNIWDRPIILPTTISYFIFLYDKIKYYQSLIEVKYKLIKIEIKNFITGKTVSSINKIYTTYYFEIIILSKIINDYYKSYKEVEEQLIRLSPIIEEWLGKIPEIKNNKLEEKPIQYDKFAEILNKINSSYYLYHYIFQEGNAIELNNFNFFQLPRKNEAIKYLYFTTPGKMFDMENELNKENASKLQTVAHTLTNLTQTLNNTGLFNIYDITSNNTPSHNHYLNNRLIEPITSSFAIDKKISLPPSVYINFEDFYKYTTIYLIKKILPLLEPSEELFTSSQEYIKKYIKPPTTMIPLYTYLLISKIIEQLIIDRYNTNITDQIIQKKLAIINMSGGATLSENELKNFDFLLAKFDSQTISITLDNNTKHIQTGDDMSNLYKLVIQPTALTDDKVVFILYPNDLTNINKFKIKNGITINPNIIKLLIDSGGIPYHLNIENLTPIDYLLKNYQIETIEKLYETLTNNNITFYNSKNSIKYISDELNNILGKIISKTEGTHQLKYVLLNFHQYLYEDIHQLILANNRYGNNEFIFIPVSFNISTYLILHYLKTTINTIDVDTYPIYLYTQMDKLQIYKNINSLIAEDVLSTKKDLLKTSENYLQKLNKIINLNKLETIQKEDLQKQIDIITKEIDIIKNIIRTDSSPLEKTDVLLRGTLIESYDKYKYNNVKSLKALKVWEKFFDIKVNIIDNYDMELIHIIIKQIDILKNKKEIKLQELKEISDKLKKIFAIGENYFTKPKFTDENKIALFIKDMLTYVATITFETSIFLLVKRILFTYFTEIFSDPNKINATIKYILKVKINKSGDSFMKTLVGKTIPDLVTLASNIYKNKQDETTYETNTSRQILLNLFEHLKEGEITLSEEILNTFDRQVVEYLDTFIVKTIEMWHVNAENIFKYFINNYRCLATLICLIEHNN